MQNNQTYPHNRTVSFIISSLAIVAGFILTIVSWMEICTTECAAVHNYRLFGMPFESIGLLFFPLLLILHFLSLRIRGIGTIAGFMLASALGAEVFFILIQKYKIHAWCPICLTIAAMIAIASLAYLYDYAITLKTAVEEKKRREIMQNLWKGFTSLLILFLGFTSAFYGVVKVNVLAAEEDAIKQTLFFGNPSSPIEIYLFTDWACPACRQLEPQLSTILPAVTQNARFTFVDFAIHPETLNFSPYNLSFMVNNKNHYLELRDALGKISLQTKTPTDEDVANAIKPIKYQPLHYSQIAAGLKYFKHVGKEFEIDSTPVMVITSNGNKEPKKLYGSEITEENILKTIKQLHE